MPKLEEADRMGSEALRSLYRFGRSMAYRAANLIDPPVLVLLYHSVTDVEDDRHQLTVQPQRFQAQMEWLKAQLPILRFGDDWSAVREPSVVVTFDDGYANNLLVAIPILEALEVPATFFLATGPIESREAYWWDQVDSLVLEDRDQPPEFILVKGRTQRRFSTNTVDERAGLHDALIPQMKTLAPDVRSNWMEQLQNWAGAKPEPNDAKRPLTIAEVAKLAASPVAEVGAHGVTHSALSALSPAEQQQELATSKEQLEQWCGRRVGVYAYPYGDREYFTRESMRICRRVGFRRSAAANFPGLAHRWTHPHAIPRQMIFDWPVETFAERVERYWGAS